MDLTRGKGAGDDGNLRGGESDHACALIEALVFMIGAKQGG